MKNDVILHNYVTLLHMMAVLVYQQIGTCMEKSETTQPVYFCLIYNM